MFISIDMAEWEVFNLVLGFKEVADENSSRFIQAYA